MRITTDTALRLLLLVLTPSWAGAQVPAEYSAELGSLFYGGSWYAHYAPNASEDDAANQRIYRVDMVSPSLAADRTDFDAPRVFYTSAGYIAEPAVPSRRGYVALTEHFFEEDVPPDRATYSVTRPVGNAEVIDRYYENSRLIILDNDGEQLVAPIDFVRAYVWNPRGDKLAYITGTYYEGGLGFLSTGTWVVDIESGAPPLMIYPSGWDLSWAEADGRLYIWEITGEPATVLRYDDDSGEGPGVVEPTDRHGIYMSLGGTYYFSRGRDGEGTRVFVTEGNREVTSDHPFFSTGIGRRTEPRGWLDDETLVMPSVSRFAGETLYLMDEHRDIAMDGFVVEGVQEPEGVLRVLVFEPQTGRIEVADVRPN